MNTAIAEVASSVPITVLEQFGLPPEMSAQKLKGGEINHTYLLTDEGTPGGQDSDTSPGRKIILQRLHKMFGRLVLTDMDVISRHLEAEGWEVPQLITTTDGALAAEEPGIDMDGNPITNIWRASTFIESEGPIRVDTEAQCSGFGKLLADFHASLSRLDYKPQHVLEHFHDTPYYMNTLTTYADGGLMPSEQTAQLTAMVLEAHGNLMPLPDTKNQIIQGDPKPDNVLARDSMPYTFIDPDTMMWGTIWIDIGDAMRSMAEAPLMRGEKPLDPSLLRAFAEGYRQSYMRDVDPEQFFKWSLTAMEVITVELSSRYLIDTVENKHFEWDRERFESREASHVDRVKTQWQIYDAYHHLVQGDTK